MRKEQLTTLANGFMFIGVVLILLDMTGSSCLNPPFGTQDNLRITDVYCVINSEMYDPFIPIFFILSLLFHYMARMEGKKK